MILRNNMAKVHGIMQQSAVGPLKIAEDKEGFIRFLHAETNEPFLILTGMQFELLTANDIVNMLGDRK